MKHLAVGRLYKALTDNGIFEPEVERRRNGCWAFCGLAPTLMPADSIFLVLTRLHECFSRPGNQVSVYRVVCGDKVGFVAIPDGNHHDGRVNLVC